MRRDPHGPCAPERLHEDREKGPSVFAGLWGFSQTDTESDHRSHFLIYNDGGQQQRV